jgi:molybdopterin-biosynthesis enzyme MoeA-like protein
MMLDALTGTLEGGLPVLSRTVGAFAPESEIADLLRETERAHEGCQIGSYPFFNQGRVGANFVCRSVDATALDACVGAVTEGLKALGYETVEGGI